MQTDKQKTRLRQWAERWWKLFMLANVIGAITLYLLLKYNDEVARYFGNLIRSL